MEPILQYLIQFIPTLVAIAAELGIVKYAFKVVKKAIETKELADARKQNEVLLQELREAKRLNKELLTKIDHIARGE